MASVVAPILTACASQTVPVTDMRPWRPLHPRCADTIESRREMNAHNSVYDSLRTGRAVVYSDHCPKPKPAPMEKTS